MSPCDKPQSLRYERITSPILTRGFSLGMAQLLFAALSYLATVRHARIFCALFAGIALMSRNREGGLQFEIEHGFAGHADLLAFGGHLHGSTDARAGASANRGA